MKTVTKTVFKVGDFISWARSGHLDLSPRFQRRPVWKSGAKSYLIDTIIRGLPIPIVFLRDRLSLKTLTTSREVVDGQQRLRTILSFIDQNLISDFGYEHDVFSISKVHNKDYANAMFSGLPPAVQQSIIGYEVPVHVFSADTEDRDILQIFARLNSTGVKLNDQELRNAEFFGAFKSQVYTMAYENLNRWQDWKVFSLSDISRMLEVEEVSDLIISMHEGVHAKNKTTLDSYYQKYDEHYPEGAVVEKRFDSVMSAIEGHVGLDLKNLQFSKRALFNDLFVSVYHLMYGIGSPLKLSQKAEKLPARFAAVLHDLSEKIGQDEAGEAVARSLRGATSHFGSRLVRTNYILDAFGHVLT